MQGIFGGRCHLGSVKLVKGDKCLDKRLDGVNMSMHTINYENQNMDIITQPYATKVDTDTGTTCC